MARLLSASKCLSFLFIGCVFYTFYKVKNRIAHGQGDMVNPYEDFGSEFNENGTITVNNEEEEFPQGEDLPEEPDTKDAETVDSGTPSKTEETQAEEGQINQHEEFEDFAPEDEGIAEVPEEFRPPDDIFFKDLPKYAKDTMGPGKLLSTGSKTDQVKMEGDSKQDVPKQVIQEMKVITTPSTTTPTPASKVEQKTSLSDKLKKELEAKIESVLPGASGSSQTQGQDKKGSEGKQQAPATAPKDIAPSMPAKEKAPVPAKEEAPVKPVEPAAMVPPVTKEEPPSAVAAVSDKKPPEAKPMKSEPVPAEPKPAQPTQPPSAKPVQQSQQAAPPAAPAPAAAPAAPAPAAAPPKVEAPLTPPKAAEAKHLGGIRDDMPPADNSMSPVEAQKLSEWEQSQLDRRNKIKGYCTASHLPGNEDYIILNNGGNDHWSGNYMVDNVNKVIICTLPKTATTYLKLVLANISGNVHFDETQSHARLQTAHRWDFLQRGRLTPLNKETPEAILYKVQNYKKFMFVRNPIDRFIGAYQGKLEEEIRMPGVNELVTEFRDPEYDSSTMGLLPVSFEDFAKWFIEYGHTTDNWNHYHLGCVPCFMDYDYIGHVENLQEDLYNILLHVYGKEAAERAKTTAPIIRNAAEKRQQYVHDSAKSYLRQLSDEDAKKLYEAYRTDITLFGYEEP